MNGSPKFFRDHLKIASWRRIGAYLCRSRRHTPLRPKISDSRWRVSCRELRTEYPSLNAGLGVRLCDWAFRRIGVGTMSWCPFFGDVYIAVARDSSDGNWLRNVRLWIGQRESTMSHLFGASRRMVRERGRLHEWQVVAPFGRVIWDARSFGMGVVVNEEEPLALGYLLYPCWCWLTACSSVQLTCQPRT